MSSYSKSGSHPTRRAGTTLIALGLGLPMTVIVLGVFFYTPLRHTPVFRYVEFPVQWVEVAFFCCGVAALGARFGNLRKEHLACDLEILPRWDGTPVPVAKAKDLIASVDRQPAYIRDTYFGRRIRSVLEFIIRRRSAAELDDQMRSLSDADNLAQENAGGLVRFITWAIPILGFLGTVIGITGAISGVTPEVLEQSLSTVTDGLSEAFDSTALALGLTMVLMFLSYLVDRQEQSMIIQVDGLVEGELGHRFERDSMDSAPFVAAVQQSTLAMTAAVEALVRKQAEIWAAALGEPDKRAASLIYDVRDQLTGALGKALDQTIEGYAHRLASLEQQAVQHSTHLLQQLASVAQSVKETGQSQQEALTRVAEGITGQASTLAQLQQDATNLVHLQAVLHQNLAALASAGSFDEAVHSLTAAVHMLTARVTTNSPKHNQGLAA